MRIQYIDFLILGVLRNLSISVLINLELIKRSFLLIILMLLLANLYPQASWRPGEMEIRVTVTDPLDLARLHDLRLQGDMYPGGYGILYVTPEEIEQVRSLGISYEITKPDLNSYFKDFWESRDAYHTYEEIIASMNSLSFGYAAICKKIDFGISLGGRQLTALKISDNVNTDENETEVMFDGGIHGDEIGGAENLIRFAEQLCQEYNIDPDITYLINNREIWLYIMVNPDGRANMVRYNSNGVDLNRDAGYMWDAWGDSPGAWSQPETKAIRNCIFENQPVIYTTYHSGTEYLLYPWAYRPDLTPDNAQFDFLASIYSVSSGYSYLPYGPIYTSLYPVNGSTSDASFGTLGNITWAIEISTDKQPPTSQIQYYYDINYTGMIAIMQQAEYGIAGLVTDAATDEPVQAIVLINDYYPCYNDPVVGDYHQFVLPGNYSVKVVANGYAPMINNNIVVSQNSTTVTNFALQPEYNHYAYRIVASQIPDNNFDDEGNTPAVLWEPDDVNYSIGKSGWAIIDMGETIYDGPGSEITIYEGDNDPEGYGCYASTDMDGPWTFLGNGTGNKTFNFSSQGLMEARYIRIIDDGSGSATGDNAGFDLDAIEILEQPPVIYLLMDCYIDDAEGNNNNRIDPGENVNLVVTLRNHGGLVAENITANLNYDSTWLMVPDPDVTFGTLVHGESSQASIPAHVDEATPLEEIVMMVLNVTANDGTFVQSFPMNFTVGAIIEDWETNNFLKFLWSFTGTMPWTITPLTPQQGSYCAKSGNINDNETSGLKVTMKVIGLDDISFYRKISSEAGFDFLNFYIDNTLVDQWSGTLDWEFVSYSVSRGTHTFRWTYEKDGQNSHGFDCGWIDFIKFPSCNLDGSLHALANAFPYEFCGTGESQLGAYVIGGTGLYSFTWTPPEGLSNPNAQFPVASPTQTTVYSVQVTDLYDTVVSHIQVLLHPIPETPVVVQQGDSLVSSSPEGNQWYDSNGPISGATAMVYYPQVQDYYLVIVTSEAGCVSAPSEPVYFLFTGLNKVQDEENIIIYPNPVRESLKIELKGGISANLTISFEDLLGQVLYQTEITGISCQLVTIPTSDLPKGIYLISIRQDGGKKFVEKILK